MNNREQFEAFLVSEYAWANDALNAADFHGDDATGYYTGGDYIYDGQSCSEGLFWAWRGWQAASKASEQQLAAVVAENEVLKTAAEFATADDMWIEQADGMLDYRYVDWYVDVLKTAMETPATDAFLAEVRAQGVDAAIEQLHKKFEGTGHIGVPVMVLESFAAQLRQGAEHE